MYIQHRNPDYFHARKDRTKIHLPTLQMSSLFLIKCKALISQATATNLGERLYWSGASFPLHVIKNLLQNIPFFGIGINPSDILTEINEHPGSGKGTLD